MKRILLIILLVHTYTAYPQLPEASLKKMCIKQKIYAEGADTAFFEKGMLLTLLTADEMFKGHFKNTRIFLASYLPVSDADHGYKAYAKLYAVNAGTGAPVNFKDKAAFYHFVNSANKKITNLDKSYLYLFLCRNIQNTTQHFITEPMNYAARISDNSAFAGEPAHKLFIDDYCAGCFRIIDFKGDDLARNDILTSADNNLLVYTTVDYIGGSYSSGYIRIRYQFTFDDKDNMTDVRVDTLKW